MSFSIRDPILENITCTADERALINSPLVQRLKWVTQLSLVNHVFNGATHSRFAHSLGALSTAGEYMTHLLETVSDREWRKHDMTMTLSSSYPYFKEHYIKLARVAGLLHDVGHGPFSHSFDKTIYQKIYGIPDGGHDLARINLVTHELIYEHLEENINPEELVELWSPGSVPSFSAQDKSMFNIIRNIVEGPLGADRIDFTRRDSHNIGMQHLGTIPASRIIQNSKIVFVNNVPTLSYHAKCIEDIIRTLDGRLSMYTSVYLHKTSVAASLLVEKMMDLICEPFGLVEMTKDPDQFKRLTDHKIFAMISEWCPPSPIKAEDLAEVRNIKRAQQLYEQLMDRQLPKMEHEVRINDFTTPFNEQHYVDLWYPNRDPSTFIIYCSRPISGISAAKFDKYGIVFHDNNDKLYTCQELLDSIGYTVPIKPFYIVRGYVFR